MSVPGRGQDLPAAGGGGAPTPDRHGGRPSSRGVETWEPVEVALRRHSFSTPVVLVAAGALVALPVAVAIAITVTVLAAGSTVGGVLVGLVVPLALVGFAAGVARPLVAGRRVALVLRADALVIADRSLFHAGEGVPRHAVRGAWIGPAVDTWLGALDPTAEVSLAPDDEPVDLLLVFDELVAWDHARRRTSRPKGDHRSVLPHPERPVGRLWVPIADPGAAAAALDAWLPTPPVPAPPGTPAPELP